jgi:hypothetical protein
MRRIPAREHYRPERHYMRGPGPKSAARSMPGAGYGNAPESAIRKHWRPEPNVRI